MAKFSNFVVVLIFLFCFDFFIYFLFLFLFCFDFFISNLFRSFCTIGSMIPLVVFEIEGGVP